MNPRPQATEEIQQQHKEKIALGEWNEQLISKAEGTKERYNAFIL